MIEIPSSVPVFIQNVKSNKNNRFSTAKLKVFYKGETPDKRLFTESFSNEVIKTLPSTPVVGYYSEEKEDFIGHNKIQYVYGHVPETATCEFIEEDDGKVFAVTDVILYTERTDNIGEVAKKIVGKQHSLELNTETLKYKINKNLDGSFKNIEFLSGDFIGLSVLGDDETPAFKGSEFFKEQNNLDEFMEKYKENFNRFCNFLNTNGGKIKVFNSAEYFANLGKCMLLTMQEFQSKIYEALSSIEVDGYIVQNTEEMAVIREWDKDYNCKMYRYNISMSDQGQVILSNKEEVFERYLSKEEADKLELVQNNTEQFADNTGKDNENEDDKTNCSSNTTEAEDDKNTAKVSDEKDDKTKCNVSNAAENNTESQDPQNSEEEPKKEDNSDESNNSETKTENEKKENCTNISDSSALSDSEKLELENYRRQEKINLINSYSGYLDETQIKEFIEKVDSFTKKDLEAELAISFKNAVMDSVDKKDKFKVMSFAIYGKNTEADYNECNPADVIRKYKK